VSALESNIDALYKGPLGEFVSARTALARSLSGSDAKRVKALQKPAVVPWAVNQVYWHARPAYDRLLKSGEALRSAQISALGGRSTDVRGAGETHRAAIAGVVKEARRLSASSGVQPNADALARTFEALSLATRAVEVPGRLTRPMSPAGFEALAGVTVKAQAPDRHAREASPPGKEKKREQEKEKEKEEADRKQALIRDARASFEQARQAEASARADWERRKRDIDAAWLKNPRPPPELMRVFSRRAPSSRAAIPTTSIT
jgi:hypothetical protein